MEPAPGQQDAHLQQCQFQQRCGLATRRKIKQLVTVKIFGCSFVSGLDLESADCAWPALIAHQLGVPHKNYAQPGIGNLQILERVLRYADSDSVCVINWTWIDRFDFVSAASDRWHTLRPVLDHPLAPGYFRDLHSQYRDMLTNLCYIACCIQFLQQHNYRFHMTYLDDLLFETVQPGWHDPRTIQNLQHMVRPCLRDFSDLSFYQWARSNGFAMSDTLHPLQDAHCAAAALKIVDIKQALA